ncbi:MAG: hypothetical protein A2942_02825 [Candidatus Lloydbacteria bacterium RIFCSPLOWO2_01_FULL_50_20]|uniref:Uncharacterized protein n=1 Tax=Candidatus Lloydbacteria bacterium RIFCSPLOWO2_01_FULL_50_20 TaxID=1798665 RepID=A0A1G2DJK4_9BACT|nr:MAG: hypothetical protein A2942_02825 [Candidatus Lloydbacteria bacterium RIFCSPLOWO2_01_FULL_50_20]
MKPFSKSTENFLLVFAFLMFFLGLYLGRDIWRIDQNERVADIVSCGGYEEKFLQEMGFKDRNDCAKLNLALHRQYIDDCVEKIKTSNDESYDRALVDSCVYHLFEIQAISLSSEYTAYKKGRR